LTWEQKNFKEYFNKKMVAYEYPNQQLDTMAGMANSVINSSPINAITDKVLTESATEVVMSAELEQRVCDTK